MWTVDNNSTIQMSLDGAFADQPRVERQGTDVKHPSESVGRILQSASSPGSNLQRRPFTYNPRNQFAASDVTGRSSSLSSISSNPHRDHNMAIRYRLFSRLDRGAGILTMPEHVVPSEFFSVLPFDDFKDDSGKQSSIVTIFSIWNTMMGTSVLAMPWALQQAGFALGIFLILSMAMLSLYTAYRVVESPSGLTLDVESSGADFADVCRYFWGKRGNVVATFFSLIVLLGGVIVYWVLMSNFLFHTGNVFHDSLQPNGTTVPVLINRTLTCDIYCPEEKSFQEEYKTVSHYLSEFLEVTSPDFFSYANLWKLQSTVPMYLAAITLPLLNFKSPTFFMKFNMLGTISVIYLLSFVASKALECGINLNFVDTFSVHYARLFSWRFPAQTGTLALSFFIHNAVLTILKNQRNPENNARDLTIGYILAAFCYLFVAVLFFIAFPATRSCISDNFLNNFGSADVMSAAARLFLLFQMMTVLPLLMYLIRTQFFYAVVGTTYPGIGYVLLLNICVLTAAVVIAVVYPHVGGILRYVGAISGLVYIFALPCAVHLKRLKMRGTLGRFDLILHIGIIFLGLGNLISQFVIG